METRLILIRYGELGLKGKNKKIFISKLVNNVRASMHGLTGWAVRSTWGRLWLEVKEDIYDEAIDRLKRVFGIYSVSPVLEAERSLPSIQEKALAVLKKSLPNGGTFKVETRRADKTFPGKSPEISKEIAEYLFEQLDERYDADMHHPDLHVYVEIRGEGIFVFGETIHGAGGLPVSCSGKALVMLSGGIDSPVAAWMAMKRGVAIEAIHYHSFPFTGEKAKEKVYDLCKILSKWQGAPIRLHMIHFTEIQKAIYEKCDPSYGITIMRRFMFRIAERIANQQKCLAIYTGESVGQVASQTLESMNVINKVVDIPVLRPLVGMDKEDIMAVAQKIGTFDISILPYEDCCTVFLPQYPKIRPILSEVEELEKELDIDGLIADALEKSAEVLIGK